MIEGPFTEKYLPAKVDVVQFVPIDVAPGGGVADDRVVLPAVPQPAHHLDGVGGLVEQLVAIGWRVAPAEQRGLVRRRAHPRLPARPPVRHVVQGGDGLGDVERLGVGDGCHRDQPDVRGDRGDARGDQHGVAATGQPPWADGFAAAGLGHQGVVDGEEVQQTALSGGRQAGPVPAAEHRLRARVGGQRGAPRLRVPAVAVERNAQVQQFGACHARSFTKAIGKTGPTRGQRLGKPGVAGRFIERLGLGLAVARRQVDPPVAPGGDDALQLPSRPWPSRGGDAADRSRSA